MFETNQWSSYLFGMNVTNNFFIVNGQAARDNVGVETDQNYFLNFTSTIYPLDFYGNFIYVGSPKPASSKKIKRLLQEDDSNDTLSANPAEFATDASPEEVLVSEKLSITTQSEVEIFCPKHSAVCDRNIFIFYPEINHNNYKIEIKLDTGHMRAYFESFTFTTVTANSKYTMFLLLLRYSLFIISVLMSSRYFKVYWSLNKLVRTFEHRAIFWLSILLIFFNDPFYAATILKSNLFFSILSTLFVCAFLSYMILFWVIMLQRIHREPATPETKLLDNKSIKLLGKRR